MSCLLYVPRRPTTAPGPAGVCFAVRIKKRNMFVYVLLCMCMHVCVSVCVCVYVYMCVCVWRCRLFVTLLARNLSEVQLLFQAPTAVLSVV